MTHSAELDVQRERAAKNQSLFREVNERIDELGASTMFTTFVCECSNARCDDLVPLTREEYEAVRAGSNRFVVLPGHEIPAVDRVVESDARYLVVAKLGKGAAVAEHLDPRKRATA
jgi:hypothetical protein